MKKKKNIFKWQNLVHYVLLAGAIFFIHHLTSVWGLESFALNSWVIGWVTLFLFYTLGLFVFDTLIHFVFSILPKPYQWRD